MTTVPRVLRYCPPAMAVGRLRLACHRAIERYIHEAEASQPLEAETLARLLGRDSGRIFPFDYTTCAKLRRRQRFRWYDALQDALAQIRCVCIRR